MSFGDLKTTLEYIHSEVNRIETMAGTLSTTEQDHFRKLSSFDHREIMDIATEEQSVARQLGAMKHMCLALSQKIEGIKNALDHGDFPESNGHD